MAERESQSPPTLSGVEVLQGQRPSASYIFHQGSGHYCHLNRSNHHGDVLYFKCIRYRRYRCHGRAIWSANDGVFMEGHHNCLPDHLLVTELAARRRILNRCRSGEHAPFRRILYEERRLLPRAVQIRLTLPRIRNCMFEARRSVYPRIPESLAELGDILGNRVRYGVLSMTADGEDSIYACTVEATDGSKAVILASRRMLNFMSRVSHAFADGTFCIPFLPTFSQVFNIVTTWRWHIIPLVTVFMERRTLSLYKRVFQELKALCPNFHPRTIMSDFEAPQQRAWREEFPYADWLGCLYHYIAVAKISICFYINADVIEYAKSFGLTRLMRENVFVAELIRVCCIIPLVPFHLMREAHRLIAAMGRATIYYDVLREVFDYIYRTWLTGPRFLHVCVCYSEERTNNASESFNRMLRSEIGSPHPNVWHLLNIMVLFNGESPCRSRRASALANDAAVSTWTADLERGDITLEEFIRCISRRVTVVFNTLLG